MTFLEHIKSHLPEIAVGFGIFLLSLVISLGAITFVVIRLPPHYFSAKHPEPFWPHQPPWVRVLGHIGKNLLGLVLIIVGAVMSLPGVPGQGLLTIFIGVILLDFPGKRTLERKIISNKTIFKATNQLRTRFKRPLLELDSPGDPPGDGK